MGWNYLSIPKLQRCNRWSLGMDKLFHPALYNWCDYISMLGLKLNPVNKRGPRGQFRPSGIVIACVCLCGHVCACVCMCVSVSTLSLSTWKLITYSSKYTATRVNTNTIFDSPQSFPRWVCLLLQNLITHFNGWGHFIIFEMGHSLPFIGDVGHS